MKKKTEMLNLWHSLTSGRHACQDVWNCRGLEPRLRCSHNLLSDQNAVISSSWWPSLVLLMFWTDFLSFGEMFDLVYFNYCPSFLFFPISLERCKTKENTLVGCQFGDQIALNSNGIFRILPSQLNIKIRYGQLSPKLLRKSLFCNFKINSWHLSAVAINCNRFT